MAFFKFRKAKESKRGKGRDPAGRPAASPQAQAQELRARARHRLIGAVALMAVAVIVFPLLFDTEQRPAVIDAPVVIADASHDSAQRQLPAAAPADSEVAGSIDARDAPGTATPATAESVEGMVSVPAAAPQDGDESSGAEGADDWALGAEVEPLPDADAALEPSATRSKIRVQPAPDAARGAAGTERADTAPARPADSAPDAEARRALAALQGRTPAQPPAASAKQDGRFVVQVGAFSQDEQARRAQQQVAAAGLKSYTQVVQTGAGPRIRVRVGPYDSRDAAERARAALKQGGLPGQVLAH